MLFIISAFIATAMGTSMGTIAACAPIAFGFTQATDLAVPLTIGAVIGGAMFGDNLSMISDTTIAATRSQNVTLRDKFKSNIWIALPASILAIVIYTVIGFSHHNAIEVKDFNAWLIIPYLVVFFLAFTRLHVLAVLMVGILVSGLFGTLFTPEYSLVKFSNSIYDGFVNLFEVTLLSVFLGGLSAMLQKQGGLAWLLQRIYAFSGKLRLARQRAGEVSIAFLVVFSNFFVANNTIAILLSGDVAREVAAEYGVDPKRSASLLDIFSCVVQGVIPYGAQILLASSIASISPLALIGNVYYCWMLAIFAILAIFTGLGKPKTTASATV
jgi:Na+/H+ antiporter NhaC